MEAQPDLIAHSGLFYSQADLEKKSGLGPISGINLLLISNHDMKYELCNKLSDENYFLNLMNLLL